MTARRGEKLHVALLSQYYQPEQIGPAIWLKELASDLVAAGHRVTVLTGFLGFSPQMGAFLAGFLLAGTPFRYQLAGQIGPMRDLLMAVFFTTVGLQVAPADVVSNDS